MAQEFSVAPWPPCETHSRLTKFPKMEPSLGFGLNLPPRNLSPIGMSDEKGKRRKARTEATVFTE